MDVYIYVLMNAFFYYTRSFEFLLWSLKCLIKKVFSHATSGLPPGQGKTKNFQSQGKVRESISSCQSQWKVREFFGIQGEKSRNFLEFREFTGFSENSRDFERKAFEMPCVQNPVKNVEIEHEDKNNDGLQKELKLM